MRAPYQVEASPKGAALPARFLPTVLSLWRYAHMTLVFFVMMYLNNLAFSFNISQPLHMVFRSANLMVSYAYGYFLEGRKYTRQQLASVVLITAGAAAATFAETILGDTAAAAGQGGCAGGGCGDLGAAARAAAGGGGGGGGRLLSALFDSNAQGGLYLLRWWLGVSILAAVLLLQTYLGSLQNKCREDVKATPDGEGRFSWETLFFFHFFALPCFAPTLPALPATFARWSASPATGAELGWAGAGALLAPLLRVPIMWVHVAVNVVTQYVCLCGVYLLIGSSDQLTVNVALTVRKFLSLLISIWLFKNTFTGLHWVGALCVIFGTALFQGLFGTALLGAPPAQAPQPKSPSRAVAPQANKDN